MKLKNITLLVVVLVVLDQILKIWIKTHLCINESIEIFPWFHLHFVENNGAAFGMQLRAGAGAFDWGKLLLSLFRMVMIGLLGYYIYHLSRTEKKTPRGVLVGLALILAGAIGNLVDSMFYGNAHLESVDAKNWDVSNCTSMKYTFNDTKSLEHIDVSGWDTSKVTNCQAAFLNCAAQVLDISKWDMSLVSNTSQFMQGTKQISITVPASLGNISANAFNGSDRGILEYHIKATTPPTLANTNAFAGIRSQAKIYVPAASLSTYQGASNWSNYSTYMVGE